MRTPQQAPQANGAILADEDNVQQLVDRTQIAVFPGHMENP